MTQEYKQIRLADLKVNPQNFRTQFDGPEFGELVQSIRQKGVIQPILVRPCKGKKKYEIVFGERRFRAAKIVSKDKRGKKTIPALVRELSDAEAFDLMLIENLQRENLTELEEAEGFKLYLDKNGPDSLGELAERTGIRASFIRRRTMVLDLPKQVLETWGRGEIGFGYLEQLARLDDEDEILEYLDEIQKGHSIDSIQDLKRMIDNQSIKIDHALFDLKQAGCAACPSNSDVQFKLFEIDAEAATCMKPSCFKNHQTAWATEHWQDTEFRKKFKTTGFRYVDDVDRLQCKHFHFKGQADKECFGCDGFVTLFSGPGMQVFYDRVCLGESSCHKRHIATKQKGSEKANSGSVEGQGDQPRVKWHGEHFRELFYQESIPQRFERVSARGLTAVQLSLFALLKSSMELKRWFLEQYKGTDQDDIYFPSESEIFSIISKMDIKKASKALKEATLQVILYDDFLPDARRIVADHMGIDLSKEWAITEAYLQKKTIPEIMGMGERFGIFNDEKAKAYLADEIKKAKFKACKKTELMDIFLKSGVELTGKVPDEIMNQ